MPTRGRRHGRPAPTRSARRRAFLAGGATRRLAAAPAAATAAPAAAAATGASSRPRRPRRRLRPRRSSAAPAPARPRRRLGLDGGSGGLGLGIGLGLDLGLLGLGDRLGFGRGDAASRSPPSVASSAGVSSCPRRRRRPRGHAPGRSWMDQSPVRGAPSGVASRGRQCSERRASRAEACRHASRMAGTKQPATPATIAISPASATTGPTPVTFATRPSERPSRSSSRRTRSRTGSSRRAP